MTLNLGYLTLFVPTIHRGASVRVIRRVVNCDPCGKRAFSIPLKGVGWWLFDTFCADPLRVCFGPALSEQARGLQSSDFLAQWHSLR